MTGFSTGFRAVDFTAQYCRHRVPPSPPHFRNDEVLDAPVLQGSQFPCKHDVDDTVDLVRDPLLQPVQGGGEWGALLHT